MDSDSDDDSSEEVWCEAGLPKLPGEIGLTHTGIKTTAFRAGFSGDDAYIFLWGEYVPAFCIEKRRVSDMAVVQTYPISSRCERFVSAPRGDCFAIEIRGDVYIYVSAGAADTPVRVGAGSGGAAFSCDENGSEQLLFAVVNLYMNRVAIHNVRSQACYVMEAEDPCQCAFSPDGRYFVIVCTKTLVTVSMEDLQKEMAFHVKMRSLFSIAPPTRVVDRFAAGEDLLAGTDQQGLPAALSFSADSSRLFCQDHGGVTVWRMPDTVKIAHFRVGLAAEAAFLDNKGRFVCIAGHAAVTPAIMVWDSQTNSVGKADLDIPTITTDASFSMSHRGGRVFVGDHASSIIAIDYKPARDADDPFDPDVAFDGIKSAAKLS